jgi:hypothetical protein
VTDRPTATITLIEPAEATRLWVARAYIEADGPGRTALNALALALSWPSPPWQAEAEAALDAARQELRDATAAARVARPTERADAMGDVRAARVAVAEAEAVLSALRPAMTDAGAAAAWALSRITEAGVAPVVWLAIGDQLVARWIERLSPPVGDVSGAVSFSIPPLAPPSGGGFTSLANGAATP